VPTCAIFCPGRHARFDSHIFGRPKGKLGEDLSLRVVLPARGRGMGAGCRLPKTLEQPNRHRRNYARVCCLKSIRFTPARQRRSEFAKRLAALGDIYLQRPVSRAATRCPCVPPNPWQGCCICAGRLCSRAFRARGASYWRRQTPDRRRWLAVRQINQVELLENLVNRLRSFGDRGGMANTFWRAGEDFGQVRQSHFYDTQGTSWHQAEKAGCRVVLPSMGLGRA